MKLSTARLAVAALNKFLQENEHLLNWRAATLVSDARSEMNLVVSEIQKYQQDSLSSF